MKLTQDERLVVDELRNLSKLNTSDVNDILKALMLLVVMNFSEGEKTTIPYFGDLDVQYLGDISTSEGRVANLKVEFIPSNQLAKNIGQLVDAKNQECDAKITDIDCIKDVIGEISNKLNQIMSVEN